MARCASCSAPLPPNDTVCGYCGSRNQVDLDGIHEYTVEVPESERLCPACNRPLRTLNVEKGGTFLIDQCPDCFGLFFDPGELDALLERSVSNVYEIDYARLVALNETTSAKAVQYRKCPICGTLMNRVSFGSRSGVIADVCKGHGVWLEGGELRQLLEWRKAGGKLLQEQVKAEREKEEKRKERADAAAVAAEARAWEARETPDAFDGLGLPDLLAGLVERLLR